MLSLRLTGARVARMVLVGHAIAVSLTSLAGCYNPAIVDGGLRCADQNRCPRGFYCRADGHCWRDPDGGSAFDADSGGTPSDGGRSLGDPCQNGTECASGFCADGVCCQEACTELCKACNLTSNPGACTNVAPGAESPPGHPSCKVDATESCQQDGTCDGSGACRLWKDGTVCFPASCSATTNRVTRESTCTGDGRCVSPREIPCDPFLCSADGTGCFTTCASSAQCSAGNPCTGSSCGPKPNGSPCVGTNDCISGICVDGVCCNSTCSGRCEACDIGATLGICSPVTSGPPHGTLRGPCVGTSPCAGACTSASRTACSFPNQSVVCRSVICIGATFVEPAGCNGSGSCPTVSTHACAGSLVCNAAGTACLTTCTSDNDCAQGANPYCVAGTCAAGRPNGATCRINAECTSTACVDGRCCNGPCDQPCEACDVDGHPGVCWPVPSGPPHGTRAPCPGTATCAGFCNGASNQCAFPNQTQCTCPGGSSLLAKCDGLGNCRALGNICL